MRERGLVEFERDGDGLSEFSVRFCRFLFLSDSIVERITDSDLGE